mmetsp:Transcript_19684/g.51746  ORF Transcript_19684/g.51746 Transcript_19684/m.51746 type:complete len:414 (-) Transcript_19684:7-1248(-)
MDKVLLSRSTGGLFDAWKEQPRPRAPLAGRISVICPTTDERTLFHAQLYSCFVEQRWPDKELVVIDTGACPSPFLAKVALQDTRLVYRHYRTMATSWPVGLKRNLAVHLASGQVVAHFDDDDLYAPGYLSHMVSKMLQASRLRDNASASKLNASASSFSAGTGLQYATAHSDGHSLGPMVAKLSQWHVLDLQSLSFGFLDVCRDPLVPQDERRGWLYGWGFSYVYTRSAWELVRFPAVDFSEDIQWIEELLSLSVPVSLLRLPPSNHWQSSFAGLCAHSSHPLSCSGGEYADCTLGGLGLPALVRVGQRTTTPNEFYAFLPLVKEVVNSLAFAAGVLASTAIASDTDLLKFDLSSKASLLESAWLVTQQISYGRQHAGVSFRRLPASDMPANPRAASLLVACLDRQTRSKCRT